METERFYLIALNSNRAFSHSCWWNRLQALSDRLCQNQERTSKLKVRRTPLTDKIFIWGRIRIAHRETRTVNNRCHSFAVL